MMLSPSARPFTLLLLLLVVNGASSQACPGIDEYSTTTSDDGSLTFKYAIVLGERSILCARLESDAAGGGWVGFGISPSGKMDSGSEDMKSTGIIGLPEDGTVLKYWLDDDTRVDPMDSDRQTLMDASITDVDGTTIMSFTKYLEEDGEFMIFPNGDNPFLYAYGNDASLGNHASRGSFMLDFEMDEGEDDSASAGGESVPSPAPEGSSTSSSGIATMRMARSLVVGAGVYVTWIGM